MIFVLFLIFLNQRTLFIVTSIPRLSGPLAKNNNKKGKNFIRKIVLNKNTYIMNLKKKEFPLFTFIRLFKFEHFLS